MNHLSEPRDLSGSPTAITSSLTLSVRGIGHIPSKKNYHYPSQSGALLIDKPIKERMQHLENAILSALYSESQIVGNETHSECWKRLRTLLSGLSDDSIREIPDGSWSTKYVPKGEEGADIEIEVIE